MKSENSLDLCLTDTYTNELFLCFRRSLFLVLILGSFFTLFLAAFGCSPETTFIKAASPYELKRETITLLPNYVEKQFLSKQIVSSTFTFSSSCAKITHVSYLAANFSLP